MKNLFQPPKPWRRMVLIISTLLLSSICLGQSKLDSVKIYSFYLGSQFRYGQSISELKENGKLSTLLETKKLNEFHKEYQDFNITFNQKPKKGIMGDLRLVCFIYHEKGIDTLSYTSFACNSVEKNGINKNIGNSDFLMYLVKQISDKEQRRRNINFIKQRRKKE